MIIRNFVAETPEDAYQMARRALGPEAIILSTSSKRQGNWITRWFRAPIVEVIAGKPRPRALTHPGFASPELNAARSAGRGTPSQPPMPASHSLPPTSASSSGVHSLPPMAPGSMAPGSSGSHSLPPVSAANSGSHSLPPMSAPSAGAYGHAPVSSAPPRAPVAGAPLASVPHPALASDPLAAEVRDLKARMEELGDLKAMLERVLGQSRELAPAPVSPDAVRAIEAMAPAPRLPETVRGLLEGLKRGSVDGAVRQKVKDALLQDLSPEELSSPHRVYEAALDTISSMIPVGPGLEAMTRRHGKPMILALVGPTGVGKTTTLAKLAAAFQFQHGLRAAFVTLDTYRIAAPEQLKQYAEIIDIPIKVAFKPEDLRTTIRAFSDRDVILVDTVGRSHRNREDIEDLARYLAVLSDLGSADGEAPDEAEILLVLSANTKVQDLREAYDVFKRLGVKGLVMTKLDETSSYGDMLDLVIRDQLAVHFVTTGQSVPDDIQAARPQDLARLVTPTPPGRRRRRTEGGARSDSRVEARGGGSGAVPIPAGSEPEVCSPHPTDAVAV